VTTHAATQPGLVVLRSPGKFFGLAGLRLGFVAAAGDILQALDDELGPWTIPAPVARIASTALADTAWQAAAQQQLAAGQARLVALLQAHGLPADGCHLFAGGASAHATALQQHLARHYIWCRLFTDPQPRFRLGLPASKAHWQRLAAALASFAPDTL
jgi:cobalamin biosynthetic protein CobC